MGGYCNGYGMPRRRSCGAATASRSATGRARAATSSPRSGGSTPRGSAACARSRRSASAARRATWNSGHRRARARVTAVAAAVVAGSRSRSTQSARPPPTFRGGGWRPGRRTHRAETTGTRDAVKRTHRPLADDRSRISLHRAMHPRRRNRARLATTRIVGRGGQASTRCSLPRAHLLTHGVPRELEIHKRRAAADELAHFRFLRLSQGRGRARRGRRARGNKSVIANKGATK